MEAYGCRIQDMESHAVRRVSAVCPEKVEKSAAVLQLFSSFFLQVDLLLCFAVAKVSNLRDGIIRNHALCCGLPKKIWALRKEPHVGDIYEELNFFVKVAFDVSKVIHSFETSGTLTQGAASCSSETPLRDLKILHPSLSLCAARNLSVVTTRQWSVSDNLRIL